MDTSSNSEHPSPESWILVLISWTLVGIPLAWGIYKTILTAAKLFH